MARRGAALGPTSRAAATQPCSRPDEPRAVADTAGVARILESGTAQVVDARPADRFRGDAPEPRPGVRAGHMAGSLNLPFPQIVADGQLRPSAEIESAFREAGVDLDRPVVTSCGSGVSAAILSLALEEIGRPAKALYDGSWAEGAAIRSCRSAPARPGQPSPERPRTGAGRCELHGAANRSGGARCSASRALRYGRLERAPGEPQRDDGLRQQDRPYPTPMAVSVVSVRLKIRPAQGHWPPRVVARIRGIAQSA